MHLFYTSHSKLKNIQDYKKYMKDYQTSVFQLYKSRLLSQKYESKLKLEKKAKFFFKEMRVVQNFVLLIGYGEK